MAKRNSLLIFGAIGLALLLLSRRGGDSNGNGGNGNGVGGVGAGVASNGGGILRPPTLGSQGQALGGNQPINAATLRGLNP